MTNIKHGFAPIIFPSYNVNFFHLYIYCLSLNKLQFWLQNWGCFSMTPENGLPAVHACHLLKNTSRGNRHYSLQVTETRTLTIYFPPLPHPTPGKKKKKSNDLYVFYWLLAIYLSSTRVFIFVTSSNNKWMLHIVTCKTIVLVKQDSLSWSSARGLIALLNKVDEMKIKVAPTLNVLIIKSWAVVRMLIPQFDKIFKILTSLFCYEPCALGSEKELPTPQLQGFSNCT